MHKLCMCTAKAISATTLFFLSFQHLLTNLPCVFNCVGASMLYYTPEQLVRAFYYADTGN